MASFPFSAVAITGHGQTQPDDHEPPQRNPLAGLSSQAGYGRERLGTWLEISKGCGQGLLRQPNAGESCARSVPEREEGG